MKIESIEQDYIETEGNAILATQVVIAEVSSPCILSRLMIEIFGRPGKENDMELLNSGDRCIVMWTQPQLSLETAQDLIHKAITA